MMEEKKKSKIRFARPVRRICKVVLPEFVVSALFTGLIYLEKIETQTDMQAMKIAGLALLLYAMVEVLLLRKFNHFVKSPTRYYCTNGLAFGILTLLAVVSACLNIGTIHTWLFLPFKLFYFPDWMSRSVSALVVGLLLFLIPVLYPPVHRWRREVEKQVEEMGRGKNRILRVVLVPLFGILLSLVFSLVIMSGEVPDELPSTEQQGSTTQVAIQGSKDSSVVVDLPTSIAMEGLDPNEKMAEYAMGAVLIFLVAEGVLLWIWNWEYGNIQICAAYLRLNYPPFAVLILLGMASACVAPGGVHDVMFLPFSLFHYGMGTGRLISAFLVGCLMTLLVLLYALVSQMILAPIAYREGGRRSLRRRIIHSYHKWQWKRGHERRKKERERQNKE